MYRRLPLGPNALATIRGRKSGLPRTTPMALIELDLAQRVAFFRDTLASVARGMPFGFQFYRLVDRVDLSRPVEAAEGRTVFELHRLGRTLA